jgi:hypothetical protein
VPSGDAGINKPYDRILKDCAEEAPQLFLRLLGLIPAGSRAEVQPLRAESSPAVVLPDYVAVVRIDDADPIIFHAEFQSTYYRGLPGEMARYGGSLAWQHRMAVESVLVLLRRQGVPAAIPRIGRYDIFKTRTSHPFRVVKLWEIDPAPVLETKDPRLLPWALLMKSTDEQVRKIAAVVARQGDEEAIGRFFLMGSLRYDRSSLAAMLGGREMGLIKAILDGSSIVQEIRQEGREEGLETGRLNEARRFLRLLLRKNFPDLESLNEIDQISSVEVLESLGETIMGARDAGLVRDAIVSAAQPN